MAREISGVYTEADMPVAEVLHEVPRLMSAEEMVDHTRVFEERRATIIDMAAAARDEAVSYREVPFKVGSAVFVVGHDAEGKPEYTTFASHNFTPSKAPPDKPRTGGDKKCAERNAFDGAFLADPAATAVGVATISREKDTGKEGDTEGHGVLHPCPECRTLMRQLIAQGNLREDSKLVSVCDADAEAPVIEETTVKAVLDQYKNDASPDGGSSRVTEPEDVARLAS